LLKTDSDSFANASAIYSYLMTLHKKVSIYSRKEVEYKFSFLPWHDKLKTLEPSSADLSIEVNEEVLDYYNFFKNNGIKINKKMATSLYSALLMRYDNFNSLESNGMVFAAANELIELGAEYRVAQKEIVKSNSLAFFRLKAILYEKMLLVKNASEVELFINEADLSTSGASMKEVEQVMQEVLTLVHVRKVVLKKSDEDMKTIKTVEEIKFEQ
jgi:bifunctional oligoribonuclease and PAP phosphatase NrnA